MPVLTKYASFDLHQPGVSANDAARAEVDINHRGNAATGTVLFTDPNRDFDAEGVDSTWRIQITEGSGNLQRDTDIVSVGGTGDTVLTLGVGNFDASENNLLYRIYQPPTASEILANTGDRGDGMAGWQEFLQGVEAEIVANDGAETLLSSVIDITYAEGLTQQVIIYEDQA